MNKLKLRIVTVAKLVVIGWRQPVLFTVGTFTAMSKIMEEVLRVAEHGKPRMFKFGMISCEEQKELVTIWMGQSAKASPYDRIVELREECDALREELSRYIAEAPPTA